MYILRVKDHFDAAHFLPWHEGKCKNLHGHRWEVEVEISALSLSNNRIVVDFGIVKEILEDILPDHTNLNEAIDNPTAEELSQVIYWAFSDKFLDAEAEGKLGDRGYGISLEEVTVWESPNCSATYKPGRGTSFK